MKDYQILVASFKISFLFSWSEKIRSVFSYSLDPRLVYRRCKVFSLKPTKPNKFHLNENCYSAANGETIFYLPFIPFKVEQPLKGMELQEQEEKDENHGGRLSKKNIRKKVSINYRLKVS